MSKNKYNLNNLETFDNKYLLKRCLSYFLPHKGKVLIGFLSIFAVSGANAGTAYLVKPAMDEMFINQDRTALLLIPIGFFALIVGKGIFRFLQSYLMNMTGYLVLEQLRNDMFKKIVHLPLSYFEESQVGMLMSRILGDVAEVRNSIPAVVMLIREFITCFGLLGVILYMNWKLAIWAAITLPLTIYPIILFGKKLRKLGRKMQIQSADINSLTQERLSGIRVIKAFNMENEETRNFYDESHNIVRLSKKQILYSEISTRIMELIGGLAASLVLWYGGKQVLDGVGTPGTFFSFMASLIMLYDPIKKINNSNKTIQRSLASAERVFSLLDSPEVTREESGKVQFNESFEGLEIKDLNFAYPSTSNLVIKNLSLDVKKNQQVALVGHSGSGKTTLANLIPKFYEITDGDILINGTSIKEYDIGTLRRSIGIVSQDTFLFNKSIRDNIAYGNADVDQSVVETAAQAAYAHEFIVDLPNGYDTVVGERGVKLSGGQKQRLTIARALVKNPPLLILDEATSALDTKSERIVQKALENLMSDRTSIVIAHRLSTVINSDRIVVMQNGEIVDVGTHEELLERCDYYKVLYTEQFTKQSSVDAETVTD
ncbi:Lipid A export ATP-binding/permease protein MsbA [Pseudodesulfovibrio profundus]|uniref:Lipid A export ATP-binding/permease protein MsbA n=1 Tax=Pseudodesulfovibrio profundus TaxID=57320 RepID=A0A2C8FDN3_9BACT|nr:ABC transporter transmembrane domain-containing protein [Pseudodesulfovibrio profundus]SOB60763.1 Lipid A export ATP-binding/permease protein MsbA [Pseudodesulfovibrio profundus]